MAKYLNEDGVGLMLQNINDHINTKLSNYLPKTTTIPTNTSDLTNDSGFVTSADTIAAANTVKTMKYGTCSTAAGTQVKGVTVSGFNIEAGAQIRIKFSYVNTNANPKLSVNGGTAYPIYYNGSAITGSNFTFDVDKIYVFTFTSINSTNCWVLEGDWDSITSATVSGWGFTKNAGTITGITMNGASKGTSGVVNLGTVVTDVSNKQDKLVSGTNIKTINGTSVLGSGNIEVSAPKHIFSLQGIHESGYLVGRIEGSTTIPTAVGSIICILNAMNGDVEITSSTPLLFEVGDEYKEFTVTDNAESFTVKLSDSISFMLIDETTLSPIVPRTSSSSSGGPSMYAYGTCSTAAGTGTKVVDLTDSNFTVSTGSIVAVKFTNTNSVATTSLKLSVAGVTAQIKYLNTTFPSVQHWLAGSIVEFVYDGSAWQVLGTIKDNVGTDTKVNQTITTINSTYPLLFSATANKSATSADAARFSSNLKYNPSTNLLTVGGISGYASTTGSYAVCSTAASASTKVIELPNTNLVEGSRFWVQFTTGNTYLGDTNFSITHKGGSLTGLKLYLNGFIGSVSTFGRDGSWQAGINLLPGYYEMLYDGGNLQLTKNFIANRAPEIHVNTGSTTGWTINNFNLYPDTHIVFENAGIGTLGIYTANFFADRSYSFEVTSNSNVVPTITLPSTLKWANGVFPTFEKSTTYHISIVNNCAVCAGFKTVEPS